MKILFDHGTPAPLAALLPGHSVTVAKALGWAELSNGKLLQAAEDAGFDLLLTTDGRIRYQQNLTKRKITLVVLTGTTKWSRVRHHYRRIAEAVDTSQPGSYTEVFLPYRLD